MILKSKLYDVIPNISSYTGIDDIYKTNMIPVFT